MDYNPTCCERAGLERIAPHDFRSYAESRIMPKHASRQQAELFLGEMIRHKLAPIRRSEYRADRD